MLSGQAAQPHAISELRSASLCAQPRRTDDSAVLDTKGRGGSHSAPRLQVRRRGKDGRAGAVGAKLPRAVRRGGRARRAGRRRARVRALPRAGAPRGRRRLAGRRRRRRRARRGGRPRVGRVGPSALRHLLLEVPARAARLCLSAQLHCGCRQGLGRPLCSLLLEVPAMQRAQFFCDRSPVVVRACGRLTGPSARSGAVPRGAVPSLCNAAWSKANQLAPTRRLHRRTADTLKPQPPNLGSC
jgi:hypothetical protein